MSNLSEEQLEFLRECETEFASRYTEADRGRAAVGSLV